MRGDSDADDSYRMYREKTKARSGFLPPKPYFDLLYLDDDLRIHRTGEDNYFVQVKDTWEAARPLLEQ